MSNELPVDQIPAVVDGHSGEELKGRSCDKVVVSGSANGGIGVESRQDRVTVGGHDGVGDLSEERVEQRRRRERHAVYTLPRLSSSDRLEDPRPFAVRTDFASRPCDPSSTSYELESAKLFKPVHQISSRRKVDLLHSRSRIDLN